VSWIFTRLCNTQTRTLWSSNYDDPEYKNALMDSGAEFFTINDLVEISRRAQCVTTSAPENSISVNFRLRNFRLSIKLAKFQKHLKLKVFLH
jgi:hypothetical protein